MTHLVYDAGVMTSHPTPWHTLGLGEDLLKLVLDAGFSKPTPVQEQAIPAVLDGADLMVSAQTGTGKTAAFTLPLIEKLRGRQGTFAVVLAPTREIALQTQAVFEQFGAPIGIRSIPLIGGVDLRLDAKALDSYPQVIVATPGRLCDHLDRANIWLDYIEHVVLDEADRMLDMGFSDQLNRILDDTPKSRQTLLFSATLPPGVDKLARKYLYEPERITVGKPVSAATTVEQRFVFTREESKIRELIHLLTEERGTVFVFTRSKEGASKLWRSLRSRGFYDASYLHSDLKQSDREQALQDFKDGKFRVLIATDVIGRGIHVDDVSHVINFDVPRDPSDYVHRIGRTGRASSTGRATTLITDRDRRDVQKLERFLKRTISR